MASDPETPLEVEEVETSSRNESLLTSWSFKLLRFSTVASKSAVGVKESISL